MGQIKIQHSTGLYTFDTDSLSAAELAACTDGKTCHTTVVLPSGEAKNLGWVSPAGIETAKTKLLATGGVEVAP